MRHDVLVRVPVVLELVRADHPPVPAQVELRYAAPEPYAVLLVFPTVHSGEVVWRFSRGLLAQGLIEAAGEGDVRVRPLDTPAPGRTVEIELRCPGGRAVFRAPHEVLREYLSRTQELVAFGAEHEGLDLDHAVEILRLTSPRPGGRDGGRLDRDARQPGPGGPSPA